MNILLEGDFRQVREWGLRQAPEGVSCQEVIAGASTTKARAFAAVALHVVHRAVVEITATTSVSPAERLYLMKYLHDAVSATPLSRWVAVEDDARAAVALEVAQRCRTAPFLRGTPGPLEIPAHFVARWQGQRSDDPVALRHFLAFLEGVVLEDLAQEPLHDQYFSKVKRLQVGFGLTTEELTTLLSVSRTAVHKWDQGRGMSREVQARIDEWLAVLARMESYWRPGLLPSIVRRHGRGLKGKTPLELILKGKREAVLEYFESLADYGATA